MLYSITRLAKDLRFSRQWVTLQIKRGFIRGEKLSENAYVVTEKEFLRVKKWLAAHGDSFPRKKRVKV